MSRTLGVAHCQLQGQTEAFCSTIHYSIWEMHSQTNFKYHNSPWSTVLLVVFKRQIVRTCFYVNVLPEEVGNSTLFLARSLAIAIDWRIIDWDTLIISMVVSTPIKAKADENLDILNLGQWKSTSVIASAGFPSAHSLCLSLHLFLCL